MPEDQDTVQDDAAQDQGDQDLDQVDTDQADQEPQKPFTPDQEQFLGSWMGRVVKKHVAEGIAPLMDRQPAPAPVQSPNVLKNFNEGLSEQMFAGDVTGALDKALTVRENAKANVDRQSKIDTDRAITKFSDDPLYKDIYEETNRIAHEKRAAGFPPGPAAEIAFAQAKSMFYESKDANPGGSGLEMASGGGQQRRSPKTAKLRPEFKKAARRDIDKGLFKDEQEYIEALSPHVRAKAII